MKSVVLALVVCGAVSLDAMAQGTPPQPVTPKATKALRGEQAKAALAARGLGDRLGSAGWFGPPVALPPLSAEDLVARNVAARGGADAWRRVQGLRFEGRLDAGQERVDGGSIGGRSSGGMRGEAKLAQRREVIQMAQTAATSREVQLPFRLELHRPHQMRMEIPFRNATAVQVFDGHAGWKVRPFLGRGDPEPYSDEELRVAASEQELDGPLIGQAQKGIRVALEGGEMVDDRKAYRLKLTLPDGQERRLWVDAENFLDLKIEGAPRRYDGRLRPVYTRFKDWRKVDGVQVAHLLETNVQGSRSVERVLIDKVQVNPELDAKRFAKPA